MRLYAPSARANNRFFSFLETQTTDKWSCDYVSLGRSGMSWASWAGCPTAAQLMWWVRESLFFLPQLLRKSKSDFHPYKIDYPTSLNYQNHLFYLPWLSSLPSFFYIFFINFLPFLFSLKEGSKTWINNYKNWQCRVSMIFSSPVPVSN